MTRTWLCLLPLCAAAAAADDHYAAMRAAMVGEVRAYADRALGEDDAPLDEAVLEVLGSVPRHEFVPPEQVRYAYDNRPLPIGHGQTISQPYIVALMTDLADPDPADVVLEIGTGSGYQAAVLASMVAHVYTIEIVPPLAEQATARLRALRYDNVTTEQGDGYYGWEAHAPFDAIIVTAAASHVPPPLVGQLRPGGRMVIPVGDPFTVQRLLLVEKSEQGEVFTRQVAAVRFVPLTGRH